VTPVERDTAKHWATGPIPATFIDHRIRLFSEQAADAPGRFGSALCEKQRMAFAGAAHGSSVARGRSWLRHHLWATAPQSALMKE
jgi:hypothetical protein